MNTENIFCDENIINVYLGSPNHERDGDLFFDYCFDMKLHMTKNYRIILETEHFYISVEADGIQKIAKAGSIDSIANEDEWIDSYYHLDEDDSEDTPFIEYEYTLFVGEKIVTVKKEEDSYVIDFSDFSLRVCSYSKADDIPRFYPAPDTRLLGTERLIKKCSCGGNGILEIDFVNDYGIRCDKCHRGTCANILACEAIEEWNNAADANDLLPIPFSCYEDFARCCDKGISFIAIYQPFYQHNQISFPYSCESIIVEIDGTKFIISSCYCGQGQYGFGFNGCIDFNREGWPYKFEAENADIRLVKDEMICDKRQFTFDVEGKKIAVISDNGNLLINNPDGAPLINWNKQ